jgi:hypothetical protein
MHEASYLDCTRPSPLRSRSSARRINDLVSSAGAVATIAFEFVTSPWRRQKRLRWGTRGDEPDRELPGDNIIDPVACQYTHAISIAAAPERVWPWLVQIGQGRGGFYSYIALENTFGCHIDDVSLLVPEFQHLEVGDSIRLHPKTPPLPVQVIEPGRALVLGGMTGLNTGSTWALVVVPDGEQSCRLLARGRSTYGSMLSDRLFFGPAIMEPVTFVMERRMLRSIKLLAESTVPSASPGERRGVPRQPIGVLGVHHLATACSSQD